MTRLRRIENRDRFFFITTNLGRNVAPLNSDERDFILSTIDQQRLRGEFFLFGYVVMPTHLHLRLSPHNRNLSDIMRELKARTGHEISRRRGVPGPIWQASYFDTIIRRVRNFWQKLEYIHRNAVEAGLVKSAEDWKWSSYRHYIGKGATPISVDPIDLSPDPAHFLWPAPWH